jgi:serine/threonine protein kinase
MRERFNQYYLIKQIDSKPSKSIYLAYHVGDGSQKVMLEIFDAACFTFDQQSKNVFHKIEVIKQLRHSSILPILDLGVEQGRPYVVREYHTYESLRRRLDRLSPRKLSLHEALMIVLEVGQGLSYTHHHHILHGNIRPETIFFNTNGEVLLSDFGLAGFIDVTKLPQQFDAQTISYMAPEQFMGSITEKSDQYALACLAYELITGRTPFASQSSFAVTFPLSSEDASGKTTGRGENGDKDQLMLIQAGSACENSRCPDYGKVGKNNIHKYGKTRKGEQRWQCKTCQATWSSSSMRAKHHPEFLIPPADLVPHLPGSVQKAVLKAMDKEPSNRYPDVSLFLKALETASSLATPVVRNHPLMTPSFSTFMTTVTEPFEDMESEFPLPTQQYAAAGATTLLSERSDRVYHGYERSQTLVTPYAETSLGSRLSHSGRSLTPTLWLAFALSSVILLLGTAFLYVLVPLHSPASSGPSLKGSPTSSVEATPISPVNPIIPIIRFIPTIQPTSTVSSVQPSLAGSFAEQGSQVYNLTTEGTLDWVDWGLNTAQDVNRKRGVPEQVSTFTLIGNGTVQRDDQYSNTYIWSDGTPVAVEDPPPNQAVYGVDVVGLNNGFRISVQASTTVRTLRLYIGTKLARGQLTATLDGQTYTDSSLDTSSDPHNTQDNGIYTLTFNGSLPGQVLTVTYTAALTNGSDAATFLQAATLH